MKENKINLIHFLLFFAPFITGLNSIWSLSLFSIVCLIGIIYKIIKNKKINLPNGLNFILIVIYLISFFVVQPFAVDKGMNLLGTFKNLSILFFVLLITQYDKNEKEEYFKLIPYSACSTAIFSFLCIPFENSFTYFNDRLQGTFSYANSYGLFLLLGVYTLLQKKKYSAKEYVMFFIMFLAIILTNSRAIIIMTIAFMIINAAINHENLKKKIIVCCSFVILFAGIYMFSGIENRVNSEMLGSSEFVTRLLYYDDAITMIKGNPFGYGYMGWYYKQSEIQTAVYDAKYVHDSVLQIMLDVGIIPTICLAFLIVKTFFSKSQNAFSRVAMIMIIGHSIIDPDFEYMYFVMLLITLIDFKYIGIESKKLKPWIISACSAFSIWYFMIFVSDCFYATKNYENAVSIIPFHTAAIQEVLYSTTSKDKQIEYANKALQYNQNVSGAYEALSAECIANNNYEKALEYEEKWLSLNKYRIYNYAIYANFLSNGLQYYKKIDDNEKQSLYLKKIASIEDKINNVLENTNPLCYKTIHKPELEIPEELSKFIEQAKKVVENTN